LREKSKDGAPSANTAVLVGETPTSLTFPIKQGKLNEILNPIRYHFDGMLATSGLI